MHLNAIIRGSDANEFRLMQDLQGIYFDYRQKLRYKFEKKEIAKKFLEKNKKDIIKGEVYKGEDGFYYVSSMHSIQMGVRPIVPIEFTFPREHLNFVLQLLHPEKCWNKKYNKYISIIRKLLKLKPIPIFDYELKRASPVRASGQIEILGIGLKDDKIIDGIEQI